MHAQLAIYLLINHEFWVKIFVGRKILLRGNNSTAAVWDNITSPVTERKVSCRDDPREWTYYFIPYKVNSILITSSEHL